MAFTQAFPRALREGHFDSKATPRLIAANETTLRVRMDISQVHLADPTKTMSFGHYLSNDGVNWGTDRDGGGSWTGGQIGRGGTWAVPQYGPIDLVPLRGKYIYLTGDIPIGNPVDVGIQIEII